MTRVPVISAMTAVTGLGRSWPDTWNALVRAQSTITTTREIPEYQCVDVPICAVERLDRSIDAEGRGPAWRLLQMVLSEICSGRSPPNRVYGGSNHGESDLLQCLRQAPTARQAAALVEDTLPALGFASARWTYTACSSGLHALVSAMLDYADEVYDDIVVTAVDALSLIEIIGFWRVNAASKGLPFPFSCSRDGLLVGEGAAALHLTRRCIASPIARIVGCGLSCDAYHSTDPDPTGRSLERAIRTALANAQLSPQDVSAVVAHGTGTSKNDMVEAAVLRRIWPDGQVPVTSVKALIGHTMGAAGLFNVLVAAEACRSRIVPPIGLGPAEMLPGIRFVVGSPHPIKTGGAILALASGFGGNNAACLVQ